MKFCNQVFTSPNDIFGYSVSSFSNLNQDNITNIKIIETAFFSLQKMLYHVFSNRTTLATIAVCATLVFQRWAF